MAVSAIWFYGMAFSSQTNAVAGCSKRSQFAGASPARGPTRVVPFRCVGEGFAVASIVRCRGGNANLITAQCEPNLQFEAPGSYECAAPFEQPAPPATQRAVKVRRDYNTLVARETLEDYALRFTPRSFLMVGVAGWPTPPWRGVLLVLEAVGRRC